MTQTKSLARVDLLESFEQMLAKLTSFCTVLRQDTRPVWVSLTEQEQAQAVEPRQKALDLYRALWYEDGQDGRETLTRPGLIGANENTMAAAVDCNQAKDEFKQAVLALKNLDKTQADALMADLHIRNAEVAEAMMRMGAARLNLKQAYRHIPLLETRPIKIGFTWSKQGKVIERIDVAEARRLLQRRRETPAVRKELELLAGIPENEVLARVRRICPHLRANVVHRDEAVKFRRKLIQAPLPILVPLQAGQPLPDFIPIPPEPMGARRLQRSDVKIDEEVFLPTLRIHRYQPPKFREST